MRSAHVKCDICLWSTTLKEEYFTSAVFLVKKPDSTSAILHLGFEMGSIKLVCGGVGYPVFGLTCRNKLSCLIIQKLEQSWVGAILEVYFLLFFPFCKVWGLSGIWLYKIAIAVAYGKTRILRIVKNAWGSLNFYATNQHQVYWLHGLWIEMYTMLWLVDCNRVALEVLV